jgi:hypothetical protein
MGVIYGLYSTRDGQIRYVGQTEYTSKKRLELSITRSLDREEGPLYDWIRGEWREGHDVRAYDLQDDIIPADLDMFENYWIEQFSSLLNIKPPCDPARATTDVGRRISDALIAQLHGESIPKD